MSRPLRIHAPGYLHHIVSRGNDKACIFTDDEDHETFFDHLGTALERFAAQCAAYCLLWNHYHLLLVPTAFPLWRVMHRVNSGYFQYFNRRHRRVGPRLQGRYNSTTIESGEYERNALRYVALNPVAAGVAARPEDWRWSSYRATLGMETVPDLLTVAHVWAAFGSANERAGRTRFSEFVTAGLQDELSETLLYGSDRLAGLMEKELEPHRANRDFVYSHRFAARLPLDRIFSGCSDRLQSQEAAHTAFHRHGYTLAEIGGVVDRDPSTVSRWIKRASVRRVGEVGGNGSA